MLHSVEVDLGGGRIITLETGKMAKQANGAVIVRSGESVVLVTACTAPEPKPGANFFPLTVDYREYTYSAGRFPGGFIKREGRPTEKEILTSRLIDRPIRPLFPEGYSHETQVIGMVLSADPTRDPSTLAIVGAGASLAISDIPFEHVLGGVRVGMVDGKLIANPTYEETKASKVNIVVAGTEDGIVMVESGAQQATEAEVLAAIEFGHDCCKKIAAGIRELVKKAGKTKREFTPPPINQELYDQISDAVRAELKDAMNTAEVREAGKLRARRRVQEEGHRSASRRAEGRSQEAVRRAEGAHLPRRDAEGPPPSGWPQVRRGPQDRRRSRRAAAHPRLGAVHARRNAGAGDGHARHQGRRAAHRAAGFLGNLQALHAALQFPAVQRGRSRLHARRGPARNRPRRTGGARACRPSFPTTKRSPTPCAWSATFWNRTVRAPWRRSAARRFR